MPLAFFSRAYSVHGGWIRGDAMDPPLKAIRRLSFQFMLKHQAIQYCLLSEEHRTVKRSGEVLKKHNALVAWSYCKVWLFYRLLGATYVFIEYCHAGHDVRADPEEADPQGEYT